MVTASDTMSADAVRALTGDSLVDVARTLRDRGLSTLPVCDDAEVLVAMLTDRDLVVGPMAQGADPATTYVRDLGLAPPVAVQADASAEDALALMIEHAVRRLPVVNGEQLVGIVTQTALALCISENSIGNLIAAARHSRDLRTSSGGR